MIYGVLLAAGSSSRMGRPKQLLMWRGRPLVRHVAEVALASRLSGLMIVLGAGAQEAREALVGLAGPVVTVQCDAYAEGLAASLRCGLSALPAVATAAVVLLVDQPLVGAALVDRMIAAFEADPAALAVVPRYEGQRGNPVLVAAGLFEELRALEGDAGARAALDAHASRVRWLDLDDPAVVTDADTPEAYARLYEREGSGGEQRTPSRELPPS